MVYPVVRWQGADPLLCGPLSRAGEKQWPFHVYAPSIIEITRVGALLSAGMGRASLPEPGVYTV